MTAPDLLSPLVLGTMTFGDTVDADGAGALLDAALDAGITHIDTANGYAAGAAEHILAELLAGQRDRSPSRRRPACYTGDAGGNSPLSPKGLRLSVDASLRGSAPTTSTCSTCTSPTALRPSTRR